MEQSKIIDTMETYQRVKILEMHWMKNVTLRWLDLQSISETYISIIVVGFEVGLSRRAT